MLMRSDRILTRRSVLAGGAAAALVAAMPARAAGAAGGIGALIEAAQLGGQVGIAVADVRTGKILETVGGRDPMPPASVAKAVTTLYVLAHLGGDFRFRTRLIASAPIGAGGVIGGDLVLAGGGDPTLSTDALGDMAAELSRAGVAGVAGRYMVWGGALPYTAEIDRDQPVHVGYNPAVSGLNLNFNRVHFAWKRVGSGYELGMDARGERFLPRAYTTRIEIAQRDLPIYTYSGAEPVEHWTVSARALNQQGSRWLPVRRPDLYAGDVFQTLARAQGVPLPNPVAGPSPGAGAVIVERSSAALRPLLTEMMRFSTNITAEAIGMTASARRGPLASHPASGAAMSAWLRDKVGAASARFVDHSGLGGASRISAEDMVGALVRLGPAAGLRGLMKDYSFRDEAGKPLPGHPIKVDAKTGTLNFVSALAGYMTAPSGRELAFAIFTGDVARRDAIPMAARERPEGGKAWAKRARRLQQQVIELWATAYA